MSTRCGSAIVNIELHNKFIIQYISENFNNILKSYLAVTSTVTFGARTSIVIKGVPTCTSVLARIRLTLVNVKFASPTTIAFRTIANELADAIFTATAIHARIRLAFVDVTQTASIKITARAITFETVDQVRTFTYNNSQ